MKKKFLFTVLVSSAVLALLDSLLSEYYYPKPAVDRIFTLLFAFGGYLLANIVVLTIPVILSRLNGKFSHQGRHFVLFTPFVFGFFVLLFVPDLYEIETGDWKYFLAATAGTLLYIKLYSLEPRRIKALAVALGLAVLMVCLAGIATNAMFPSKNRAPVGDMPGPNFILIVLDAMRGDAISSIGGGNKIRTPNFDKFISQGTVFTRAYSNAPLTQMSMPSLFTGQYASAFQAGRNYTYLIPGKTRTITEDLKNSGYDTAAVVGNIVLNEAIGITRGFDYYLLFNNLIYNNQYLATLPILGNLWQKNSEGLVSRVIRKIAGLLKINPYNFTSEFVVDLAIKYLDSPRQRPFFLWLHFIDPHDPYSPPKYSSDYQGELTKNFFAPHHHYPLETAFFTGEYVPTAEDKKHIRDLYDAEVEHLDRTIAPLLEKIGQMENTVVVIASDHGEAFWEHGIYYHAYQIYTEMLHVPLVFYGPGVPEGKKISTPVTNINIVPTVRNLLNIPSQKGDEGESLTGLFNDEKQKIHPNFIEYFQHYQGVIFDNYYLIKEYGSTDIEDISLTNLIKDPRQKEDIKNDYPDVVAQGMELLNEFKKTHLPPKKRPYDKKRLKKMNKALKALGYIK